MGLEGYGLEVGKFADMLVLQGADPIEAVRLRATRLAVIRRGHVVARTPPTAAELTIPGRPKTIDPASYAPASVTAWLDPMTPVTTLRRPGFPQSARTPSPERPISLSWG